MRDEEQRRVLEQKLAEADKMRALGQLTGGVAHDFNNLMTVVAGAADLLDGAQSEQERRELVDAIRSAADAGGEINAGLLAYARRQQLQPEAIDLEEFFRECRRLFMGTVGQDVTLEIDAQPCTILADRGQLTAAVVNLLANAREASPPNATITVAVTRQCAADSGEGEWARLSVRDPGEGMNEEQIARCVEPFYSTKDTTMASGLGLSQVDGFTEQSGGCLEIVSELGAGTTMTLVLPLVDRSAVSSAAKTGSLDVPRQRVLLVDDNEEVLKLVGEMLRRLGHEVFTAESGEIGLQVLDAEAPDVLVSDVLMPGSLSGVEFARRAREARPDLLVLMISGFAEGADLEFPLLAKPFRLRDLQREMRALLVDG